MLFQMTIIIQNESDKLVNNTTFDDRFFWFLTFCAQKLMGLTTFTSFNAPGCGFALCMHKNFQ